MLLAFINNLQVGRLPDGSAIGMGLGVALQRLDKVSQKQDHYPHHRRRK
ncbi:MAG: hypothetical protein R2778_01605 [Saprospiraceae bacterium]